MVAPKVKTQNLLSRGSALAEAGRLKEAANTFHKATKVDPTCTEAHFNLATILSETGHSCEAIGAWEKVIALSPDILGAHRAFGESLLDYEIPKQTA